MPSLRALLTSLGLALSVASTAAAQAFPTLVNSTFPLTLAVAPACGSFSTAGYKDANAGVTLAGTRTIVAFGDSWTSNGANGTVPVAPILHPPLPSAGAAATSNRRASNGYIWVEDLADSLGAKLLNYAWGGAIIDRLAWNTTKNLTQSGRTDFVDEVRLFQLQGKYLDALVPTTTLYTVSFGINDQGQYGLSGGSWDVAYNTFVAKLDELQAAGAKNILVQGMYRPSSIVDFQNRVFARLAAMRAANGTNVAFVDLARLFTAISNTPATFGYAGNATCLVSANTIVGGCDDPDHAVFWIPGHPSLVTHELIHRYTQAVLETCTET